MNNSCWINNYRVLIEPAKALGVFKLEYPNAGSATLAFLDRALMAYNDADRLWNASIYKSRDAGAFGRILNYQSEGLMDVVARYNLATTTVLFTPHISANSALPVIWRYAENAWKEAFDSTERKNSDLAASGAPANTARFVPPDFVACKVENHVFMVAAQMCNDIAGVRE